MPSKKVATDRQIAALKRAERPYEVGILGHTPKEGAAVTSVYDRHSYIPEKRETLVKWESHLRGL
jgi:hypothetical protein